MKPIEATLGRVTYRATWDPKDYGARVTICRQSRWNTHWSCFDWPYSWFHEPLALLKRAEAGSGDTELPAWGIRALGRCFGLRFERRVALIKSPVVASTLIVYRGHVRGQPVVVFASHTRGGNQYIELPLPALRALVEQITNQTADADDAFESRPLGRRPATQTIAYLVPALAALGLVLWRPALLPPPARIVLLAYPAFVAWRRAVGTRCPECSRRLVPRRIYLPSPGHFRLAYDCSHCRITWHSGELGQDGTAD